eukprot:GFUD01038039.1.p1 GENE.GFUD01038039.1~~GFUD01038039.1.p1  ORF type:complete len:263 (-),score=67.22 GFUD01038039.1:231-1019(-)
MGGAQSHNSPRHTRSSFLLGNNVEDEGSGLSPLPSYLGPLPRLRLRSQEVDRGQDAGGTEIVDRSVPVAHMRDSLPDQSREVASDSTRDDPHLVGEQPPVIDLSGDPDDSFEPEEISQDINNNIQPLSPIGAAFEIRDEFDLPQVTTQSLSPLDTTIDLTGSPDTPPHLVPSSSNQPSTPSHSSTRNRNPSSTPSVQSIQCPVCLESLSSISRKGYKLVSTTCGHVFCSVCLPDYISLNGRCPTSTCRQRLTRCDYHQLFLN